MTIVVSPISDVQLRKMLYPVFGMVDGFMFSINLKPCNNSARHRRCLPPLVSTSSLWCHNGVIHHQYSRKEAKSCLLTMAFHLQLTSSFKLNATTHNQCQREHLRLWKNQSTCIANSFQYLS